MDTRELRKVDLNLRSESRLENQLEELALGNLDFAIQVRQTYYGLDYRLPALAVLRQTDFMPAPAYLLEQGRVSAGITGARLPPGGKFDIEYALVAHKRTANSALHNWLCDLITDTAARLRAAIDRRRRQSASPTVAGSSRTS